MFIRCLLPVARRMIAYQLTLRWTRSLNESDHRHCCPSRRMTIALASTRLIDRSTPRSTSLRVLPWFYFMVRIVDLIRLLVHQQMMYSR
jgi:hypothetical protein